MKVGLPLVVLVTLLTGCFPQMLMRTPNEARALEVVSALNPILHQEGFTTKTPTPVESDIPNGAERIFSWWNARDCVFVEVIATDLNVFLRIVTVSAASQTSRETGARVRALVIQHQPGLRVELVNRSPAYLRL